MVAPQKKGQVEGSSKRDSTMVYKKDNVGGGRGQNVNRGGFRTDSAISNSRLGQERTLTPWVPDSMGAADGGLETTTATAAPAGGAGAGWDQFAENERLFGLKTDYNENMYTTAIDKSHPKYRERMANAEKKAREIERTLPATAHVAEERVMDFAPGGKVEAEDEEDKYSGVRRQDFPPLGSSSNREARYTPPAKRAPSGQATVPGAPVDPAIISSQIKGAQGRKSTAASKLAPTPEVPSASIEEPKKQAIKKEDTKSDSVSKTESKGSATPTPTSNSSTSKASVDAKAMDKSASSSRGFAALGKAPNNISATATVERDLLHSFKSFAEQQRISMKQKAKVDKEIKLTELKRFASEFKLTTPVPKDLISIIAKDPAKQQEIEARAIQNAKDMARVKVTDDASKDKATSAPGGAAASATAKPAENGAAPSSAASTAVGGSAATDQKPAAPRASPSPHIGGPTTANMQNRHPSNRQSFNFHQSFRNDRANQHIAPQTAQRNLGSRLRHNNEAQKMAQVPQHQQQQQQQQQQPQQQPHAMPEIRAPTGPAAAMDPSFNNRRFSSVPSGKQLNPNSNEFRPHAAPFHPGHHHMGPAGFIPVSTPDPAAAAAQMALAATSGPVIRRKTNGVNNKTCNILAHIKTIQPSQSRRPWEENGNLRPAFDTQPTWRQLAPEDAEKPESTMNLTYKQYFERNPFSAATVATPSPTPSIPHHIGQLPYHLQQMAPRQSPHLQPMQMPTPQPPHMHGPFNGEDHRMMQANASQSFASPRMSGAFPVGMASPAQGSYNAPVPFVSPQQMNGGAQFRNFPGGPQYPGHPSPMMMQAQYMHGNQQMVGGPQMYPGMTGFPGGAPPQPVPVPNGGYPSPGRPAPPMMAHQNSQQGQPMYGMSPNIAYQQPAFPPQGGQMNNGRGGFGSPNFNPQQGQQGHQMHQYPHRGGFNGGGKNYNNHGPQGGSQSHNTSTTNVPVRSTPEAHEDTK